MIWKSVSLTRMWRKMALKLTKKSVRQPIKSWTNWSIWSVELPIPDLVEILPSKSLLLRKKKQRPPRPNPRKRTKITSTSGWEPWKNVEIKFKFLLPKKIYLMFWKSFKRKVVVFLQENSSLYSSVHFNLRARRLLPLFCVLPETSGNTALIAPIIFSFSRLK